MTSADRSAARSCATSCSSSDRGRRATCADRTTTCSRAASPTRSSRSRRSTARSARSTTTRRAACAPASRCLWTPTTSTGTLPAYNDSLANSISSSKASNQVQKTRGFEIPQTSYAGTLDFTLNSSSLISVRGGYFDDNYKDTGVPTFSSVSYQTSPIGLGYPIPADQLGGVGFQNTPRVQLADHDHTKRGYVQADFIKAFTAGRLTQLQGRRRLPAHGERRKRRLSRRRVRVGLLGQRVHQQRYRPNRSRPVWLLRGGRHRDARGRRRPTSGRCTCRTSGRSAT